MVTLILDPTPPAAPKSPQPIPASPLPAADRQKLERLQALQRELHGLEHELTSQEGRV